MSAKPWDGRFERPTTEITEAFSSSVHYDARLASADIRVSLAHADMLAKQGILKDEEAREIQRGLVAIKEEIERGQFKWDSALEDVHMNIEAALTYENHKP